MTDAASKAHGLAVLRGLAYDAHGTIVDEGNVPFLDCTCVGDFDGLTEAASETLGLAHDTHGT